MVCSLFMYWLYYKILFSLAYPCFSCCFVNCDDCTMYMSRNKCRCWSMCKSVDFILEIWFFCWIHYMLNNIHFWDVTPEFIGSIIFHNTVILLFPKHLFALLLNWASESLLQVNPYSIQRLSLFVIGMDLALLKQPSLYLYVK